MKESEINTIIAKNFKRAGWAYKIPDPSQVVATTSVKRPFDGFGAIYGKSIYWETKRVVGYKALSFSRIESHQLENLKRIKINNPDAICWIIGAFWESRKFLHLYFFDILLILHMIEVLQKKSVNKKDLLRYQGEGMFLPISKKEFDVEKIWEITIHDYPDKEEA